MNNLVTKVDCFFGVINDLCSDSVILSYGDRCFSTDDRGILSCLCAIRLLF